MPTGFLVQENDVLASFPNWEPSKEAFSVRGFVEGRVYFLPTKLLIPISQRTVEKYGLTEGDEIGVESGRIASINGRSIALHERFLGRKQEDGDWYEQPNLRSELLDFGKEPFAKIVTAILPVPAGSVCVLAGPPGSRKTTYLHAFLRGLVPEEGRKVMLVLLNERTHEVPHSNGLPAGVEIWAATTRQEPQHIARFADLAYKVAVRQAQSGFQVVMFVDSLYRLAVLENIITEASGGYTSGGVKPEVVANFAAKRLAGAGSVPGGGSLSIVATNLVEEPNKMSLVLAETFKGFIDVLVALRSDGSVDWSASFSRGLDRVLGLELAQKVWDLKALMSGRVSAYQSALLRAERSRRGPGPRIEDETVSRFNEQAKAMAREDLLAMAEVFRRVSYRGIWETAPAFLAERLEKVASQSS